MGNQQLIYKRRELEMKKITQEEFQKRIQERFPEEKFDIIEFSGLAHLGIFKCLNCKQEITVSKAGNFLAKNKAYGCKNCHGLWRKREILEKEVEKRYIILDSFVKHTHKYYVLQCKKCGHQRAQPLSALRKHLECGCITGVLRNRTGKEFIEEVNKNSNIGDYELLSEYTTQTSKVLLKHLNCGFIWKVRPSDIIHGRTGCPRCNKKESKGVQLISKILDNYGILYEKEKRMGDSLQRFDFYFEIKSNKIVIEYNGLQHYKYIPHFHNHDEENFIIQQNRDNKKKQYCQENNIILLEIPYSDNEQVIESKIISIINKFNDYPEKE